MTKKLGTLTDSMPLPLDRDYDSFDGATLLAERIRAYWERQGGKVPFVMVVPYDAPRSEGGKRYHVRSDMIGGRP